MPFDMVTVWLVVLVVLGIIEMATVGIVSIWFCCGALLAMLSAAFGASLVLQIVVFFVSSIALLLLTRPLVLKYFKPKQVRTNADRILLRTAVVEQRIDNRKDSGLIKVNGQSWTARSTQEETTFEVGELVQVVSIEGVKAMVKKQGQ